MLATLAEVQQLTAQYCFAVLATRNEPTRRDNAGSQVQVFRGLEKHFVLVLIKCCTSAVAYYRRGVLYTDAYM